MKFCVFEFKYQISALTDNFAFFGPNLPKKGISSRKQNSQTKKYKHLRFGS